ncbi:hypothetical protein K1719_025671 [Acacia pycnantha]|nr:hypothetical protein K1719_025671 [Acacia pycnantha]
MMSLHASLVVLRITVVSFTRSLVWSSLAVLLTLVYLSLALWDLVTGERCMMISIWCVRMAAGRGCAGHMYLILRMIYGSGISRGLLVSYSHFSVNVTCYLLGNFSL